MIGTVGIKTGHSCGCGVDMPLTVLNTPAGHYLGYWCTNCGPYSRETGYFPKEIADRLLMEVLGSLQGAGVIMEDEVIDCIVE